MAEVDVRSTFVVGGESAGKVVTVLDGEREVFRVALDALPPSPNGFRVDVVAPRPEPLLAPPEWASRPRAELPPAEPSPDGAGSPEPADDGATTRVERLESAGKE